jgi:hypothetical protein
LSLSSQKYEFGIRDPRSGIRDPEETYSGSRIQVSKNTQSRIPDPDPQHCLRHSRVADPDPMGPSYFWELDPYQH